MNYDTLATKEIVNKTMEALKTNGIEVFSVETGAEALEKIKELVPRGASVMKDRKSTRLNSSHIQKSRMPSSA